MTVTYHNVLRATIEALGEMMAEFAGYKITRLRDAHAAGETELRVESALDLDATGTVLVEDLEGSAGEAVAYTGVDLTPGAQRLTGMSAPLERAHREEAEVVDAARAWSQMDLLRRATLVDYADDEDLDRVGRGVGLSRPRAFTDATFRELIKLLAYMAKTTEYALEMVLDAIYGVGSGWTIYESLIEHPAKVFITIPGYLGSSADGRTFLTSTEDVLAGTMWDITLPHAPELVISVKVQDGGGALDMSVLPSADTPPWTYVAEAAGAEGAYFTTAMPAWGDSVLAHSAPAGTDSGRYELDLPAIGTRWRVQGSWQAALLTVVGGFPWYLGTWDGERDIFLNWSDTQAQLVQSDGTVIAGPVAVTLGDFAWHHFDMERVNSRVVARVDGVTVLEADADSFGASAARKASFGFFKLGAAQNWNVSWEDVEFYTRNDKNFWNMDRTDGGLTVGSADLTSASNPFLLSDVGRLVRINSSNNVNHGLWEIIARPGIGTVTLQGATRPSNGYVSSLTPTRFSSYDAIFTNRDVGKFILIPSGTNAGSYEIDSVVSPYQVVVLGAPFTTESEITWRYDASHFATEASVEFTLVDAGSIIGVNLALRDPMPAALDVTVHHTIQESALLFRDETADNAGMAQHPFYMGGVSMETQKLLSDVKAAGVILDYYRTF